MSLVAGADLRLGRHFQCKACRDRLMDYPTLLIPRLRASACAFTKRLRTVPFLGSAFRLSGSPVTPHAFGCRDKNRTCDLQLMRLTSYQTAPRDKGII